MSTQTSIVKFRPSNGTQGDCFMAGWCQRCAKFCVDDEEYCDIVLRTQAYSIDDPEYPIEWQYDKDGEPCCTAFASLGDAVPANRCDKTIDMFRQEAA